MSFIAQPFFSMNSIKSIEPIYLYDLTNGSYSGSGSTLVNLASTGSTYNATLFNSPTYTANEYLTFNGTTQYAVTSNSQNILIGNLDFSFNMWIRFNSVTGWRAIMGQGDISAGVERIYISKANATQTGAAGTSRTNGAFGIEISTAGGTGDSYFCYDNTHFPTINVWYFYSFVYNKSTLKMYRNGTEVKSINYTLGFVETPNTDINISRAIFNNSPVDYFSGRLNYLSLYLSPLSAADILSIFNSTKGRFGL